MRAVMALADRVLEETTPEVLSGHDVVFLALPAVVGRVPKAPCRVDEMSAYEAEDAVLGYYQPAAADGSRRSVTGAGRWWRTGRSTRRPRSASSRT